VNVSVPTHRMTSALRTQIAQSLKLASDELNTILT